MSFFNPTFYFKNLNDIDIKFLIDLGIDTVLLDVDNTLSPPSSMELFEGVDECVDKAKEKNIKIFLTSNNYKKRVKPISDILGTDFVYFSLKPLTVRVNLFLKNKNINKSKTVIIGDQIFSDVLFAKWFGIRSILLEPQAHDKSRITLLIKRKLEKIIKNNILKVKE